MFLYKATVLLAFLIIGPVFSEELDVLDTLGEESIQLLKRAAAGDYLVSVLAGEVKDIPRVVVLFGEVHVKDDEADRVGREVLSLFSLRGLEGVMVESPWAAYGMKPIRASINLMHTLGSLVTWRRKGSTIHASQEQRGTITVKPDDPEKAEVVNIKLEAGGGDVITLAGGIFLPTMLLMNVAKLIPATSQFIANSSLLNAVSIYIYIQTLHFAYKEVEFLLFGETSTALSAYVFPFFYWIQDYRNEQMANNIVRAFTVRTDQKSMLVIVGMIHVSGMKKLLMNNYGFSDVSSQVFQTL